MLDWAKTRVELPKLRSLLRCSLCHEVVTDPQSLIECGHFFCKECITERLDQSSSCPECQQPAQPRHIQPSKRVEGLLEFVHELETQIQRDIMPTPPGSGAARSDLSSVWAVSGRRRPDGSRPMGRASARMYPGEPPLPMASLADHRLTSTTSAASASSAKSALSAASFGEWDGQQQGSTAALPSAKLSTAKLASTKPPSGLKPALRKRLQDVGNTGPQTGKRSAAVVAHTRSAKPHSAKRRTGARSSQIADGAERRGSERRSASGASSAVDRKNKQGETKLQVAAKRGKLEKVKEQLALGANVNTRDHAGWTPLHEACAGGFTDVVRVLLEAGAEVNAVASDNITPLHDASTEGFIDIAKLLIAKGADPDARDAKGRTPLDLVDEPAIADALREAAAQGAEHVITRAAPRPSTLVLCSSSLTRTDKAQLQRAAEMIGGAEASSSAMEKMTHLVVALDGDRRVKRTFKYLCAVLDGAWIIDVAWLHQSLEMKAWANEAKFEASGDSQRSLAAGTPEKARVNAMQKLPPLFDGCTFFFTKEGDVSSPGCLPRKELEHLVERGGGTVLLRERRVHGFDTVTSSVPYHATAGEEHAFFIVSPPEAAAPRNLPYDTKVVTPQWILDCISLFRVGGL